MRTYKVEFEISIDKVWLEDGLNAETLKRRIKDELPDDLCPYKKGGEIEIKKINIKLICK